MLTQVWHRRFLIGLCWFIALQFFFFAPFKFWPDGVAGYRSYPDKFEAWGYPPWFSFVVGAGELFAAAMLVLPRRRFLGATILVITLVGAIVTHVINHDPVGESIAAPILLALSVIVALATWPADWREPLTLRPKKPEHDREPLLES